MTPSAIFMPLHRHLEQHGPAVLLAWVEHNVDAVLEALRQSSPKKAATTHVTSNGRRLSNTAYHKEGKPRWWLRSGPDSFEKIPSVRGDVAFEMYLTLGPGRYTLGVGKGDASIRINFTVAGGAPTRDVVSAREAPASMRKRRYECSECGEWVNAGTKCWETGMRH